MVQTAADLRHNGTNGNGTNGTKERARVRETEALEEQGYDVLSASSMSQVLSQLTRRPAVIVLCDCQHNAGLPAASVASQASVVRALERANGANGATPTVHEGTANGNGATLHHNDDPVAIALEGFWTETNLACQLVDPGQEVVGELWLYLNVLQPALQGHIYTFHVDITGEQWNQSCVGDADMGGTPGFWKNWDSHETYPQEDIEAWIAGIDTASAWEGPTTTDGMEEALSFKKKDPMIDKFLGYYLATRLNVAAGRMGLGVVHNISALDPGNYLGVADGSAVTLDDIISAIESKFVTGPDEDELEVMKNICDYLNNLGDD